MDTDTDTFTWTITDTNRNPVVLDRTVQVSEDDGFGVVVDLLDPSYVSEPDLDPLTVTDIDMTLILDGFVVDHGDGTITYYPGLDFDGSEQIHFTVSDANGGSASGTVFFSMVGAPDSPTLDPLPTLDLAEGTTASFTASAQDPDTGETLSFSLSAGADPVPPGASIDSVSGEFSWTTGETDGPGQYRFDVVVADSDGLSDRAELKVNVAEANEAPILSSISDQASSEGDVIDITPVVTDPDIPAASLTFTVSGLPDGLGFDASTGRIAGSLSHVSSGSYSVQLSVADDGSPPLVDSISFAWSVSNTNRAPVITQSPSDLTKSEGDSLTLAVIAHDPDGQVLTFSAAGLPPGITIDSATGSITGVLAEGSSAVSPYLVTVEVLDPNMGTAQISFAMTVQSPPTTSTSPSPASTTSTTPTSPTVGASSPPPNTTTSTTSTTQPEAAVVQVTALPTTTTIPKEMAVEEAITAKNGLVIPAMEQRLDGTNDTGLSNSLDPRRGLAVSFSSAVETLRSHLLTSLALGVGVALLLLLGIDREEEEERVGPRLRFT
jgi:hypothetical protein